MVSRRTFLSGNRKNSYPQLSENEQVSGVSRAGGAVSGGIIGVVLPIRHGTGAKETARIRGNMRLLHGGDIGRSQDPRTGTVSEQQHAGAGHVQLVLRIRTRVLAVAMRNYGDYLQGDVRGVYSWWKDAVGDLWRTGIMSAGANADAGANAEPVAGYLLLEPVRGGGRRGLRSAKVPGRLFIPRPDGAAHVHLAERWAECNVPAVLLVVLLVPGAAYCAGKQLLVCVHRSRHVHGDWRSRVVRLRGTGTSRLHSIQ